MYSERSNQVLASPSAKGLSNTCTVVNKSLHDLKELQSNNIQMSIYNASDFEPAAVENITNIPLTNIPTGNSNFQVEEGNVSINTNSSINT